MKKILSILIIGVLILVGLEASAINVKKEFIISNDFSQKNLSNKATHTVFGEYGTATWCGYCKYAHGALKELYAAGQLDFYYVSLVTEKGTPADSRCLDDYNAYGWPTVWWDGGYRVNVGASSVTQAKAAYTSSINICGNRVVKDVDADLNLYWLGGTKMQIDVSVKNNEAATYGGTIRVYITEKISSMGWYDSGGILYTFPFLDWAFNEAISIPSGHTWSDSITWDGTSHGFPTITPGNMMIIAAVFNNQMYQGYSYPPSGNPFDAYYVDDTFAEEFFHTPNKPTISGPTIGDIGVNYEFTFTTIDEDQDNVFYWIDWGDNSNSGWIGPYTSGSNIVVNHIYNNVGIYEIKAKAKDVVDLESDWSNPHKIMVGNFAPDKPTILGPTNGTIKTGIEFTFVSTDLNGDDLFYTIKWGDGSSEDWFGPYNSGQEVKKSHSWKKEGTWYIQANVKDNLGVESGWATLKINIPRTRQSLDLLFLHIFEQFPVLNKLLENLLRY